ncbi:uncharacterized protein BCR38DRAFT_424691 [Pseudomassariella vexata]|uniref:Short-chain dehydrogenase n=1 Tax=Pseudomassariella vexata TaxID=1141098 RepID=A0A1Y2EBX4_9PEZI|nr:uncharacterized protein BCR38DRAFT_424691 [Pseudomassariella vexata]ORY68917.1 hypothetical protein BCR38DRAFT_424691 [Pseudomassariella vexata]
MARIILVLGAGSNVGAALTTKFQSLGYKLALVSRSTPKPSSENILHLQADLTDPNVYCSIFTRIRESFGGTPSVVVFNAALLSPSTEPGNIFAVPLDAFQRDLNLQVKGPYVAAGEAYKLWSEEEKVGGGGEKKQFIFTGNAQWNTLLPLYQFVTLGVAKNASAYWLGVADKMYRERGFRFFFTDQRNAQGGPAGVAGPEEHAEMYSRIVQDPDAFPFLVPFVDGTKLEDLGNTRWE